MALIKLSSIGITNLSGKAGGSVYAHNRGGSYVRNFAVPSNPQTAAQAAARAAFGAFASKWRALAQEEQSAWRAAAENFPYIDRFGDTKIMSGENLYISLNRNLEVVGVNEMTLPPSPEGVDGMISATVITTISDTDSSLFMSLEEVDLAGNENAETTYAIFASPAMSPGISYAKNKMRFVRAEPEATVENDIDFSADYEPIFGKPAVGSKVFFRIDPINSVTGERGASLFLSSVVSTAP